MQYLFYVAGLAMVLIGLAALVESVGNTRTPLHAVSSKVVAHHGREQTRAYKVLAALAFLMFGVFIAMPGVSAGFPIWPAAVAIGVYGVLAIAAHLQRDDA